MFDEVLGLHNCARASLQLLPNATQIEVSTESRELLTINTQRVLHQYTRLPFRMKTAPSIFKKIMDSMITGFPGTVDDIVVVGQPPEQVKERMEALVKRIRSTGFKLRSEKCQFFLHSIEYLGFILDATGRRPDPQNIRAILEMPEPMDVKSLRSFLGLVTYYRCVMGVVAYLLSSLQQVETDVSFETPGDALRPKPTNHSRSRCIPIWRRSRHLPHVGVLILVVVICLDAAFAATSRTLVASLGGAKRLHAISALVSSGILVLLFLVSMLFGWIIYPFKRSCTVLCPQTIWLNSSTKPKRVALCQFSCSCWRLVSDFMHQALDIWEQCFVKARHHRSVLWFPNTGFLSFSTDIQQAAQVSRLPTHALSTGVVFAAMAILYATTLLTQVKPGQGPEGGSSGQFIGYSMAGLPLFTPGQTPSHGMALLNNPETMGLGYHMRETLRGIMSEQSSRRIFSFTFVELLYGVWTNSLGLISDGFHMLFDSTALVVGLYAAVVSHWKPTRVFSYG
ncbi:unnamed protein product [Echinostoma caproni]|uniref:Reverse transcriptase domain-containing protein n=1 Tax=Echinostoma caproni TaxID=27848 RepID=A0A183AWX7_9TREM|nr:unnamed protein product [Echinostoma caproni]